MSFENLNQNDSIQPVDVGSYSEPDYDSNDSYNSADFTDEMFDLNDVDIAVVDKEKSFKVGIIILSFLIFCICVFLIIKMNNSKNDTPVSEPVATSESTAKVKDVDAIDDDTEDEDTDEETADTEDEKAKGDSSWILNANANSTVRVGKSSKSTGKSSADKNLEEAAKKEAEDRYYVDTSSAYDDTGD